MTRLRARTTYHLGAWQTPCFASAMLCARCAVQMMMGLSTGTCMQRPMRLLLHCSMCRGVGRLCQAVSEPQEHTGAWLQPLRLPSAFMCGRCVLAMHSQDTHTQAAVRAAMHVNTPPQRVCACRCTTRPWARRNPSTARRMPASREGCCTLGAGLDAGYVPAACAHRDLRQAEAASLSTSPPCFCLGWVSSNTRNLARLRCCDLSSCSHARDLSTAA